MAFLPDLRRKLIENDGHPIWLITANEPDIKSQLFATALNLNVPVATPDRLSFNCKPSKGLFCQQDDGSLINIDSCIIELTQDELLLLKDDILEALAIVSYRKASLNDLRTLFLTNHKRIIEAIYSDAYELDIQTREKLFQIAGPLPAPTIKQRRFELLTPRGARKQTSVLVTISSLDGAFYGPSVIWGLDGVNKSKELRCVPAMRLCQIPPSSRSLCKSLMEADFETILQSMKNTGVALVGVEKPLGNAKELETFISQGLGASLRSHHDMVTWDIKPAAHGTPNKDEPSLRKQYDVRRSLEFKLHSDCAERFSKVFKRFYDGLETVSSANKMLVPQQTIIFLGNHKFVHARSEVYDNNRHLQRVRFDMPSLVADGYLDMY